LNRPSLAGFHSPGEKQGEDGREDPALERLIQEGLDSGPAGPLNRRTWEQIQEESDRFARTLRRHQKRAA